jgi:2-aminoadipate transaminase
MRFAFIGGRPDPRAVPTEGLVAAAQRIMPHMQDQLILYPRERGYFPLREIAARRFADRESVSLPVDNIAITCGSMQSLALIGRLFVRPGTPVITEGLTYMGTLRILRGMGAEVVGVPLDERDGMDMDALEATLKGLADQGQNPAFIYTIATNQNPTGAILSEPRRRRLVELAHEYQVPIVEDDCYGDLIVDDVQVPPALWTMDDADSVIYVSSFSKFMGPGMRLGYLCAPDRYFEDLVANRYDGGTSALASCLVAEYLKDNLWSHIGRVNAMLREKRDVILAALEHHMADIATWTQPRGGLFIYIKLPENTDMAELRALATPQELDYSEGQMFDTQNRVLKSIRLSYTHVPASDLFEAIRRLAECVRAAQG